MAPLSADDETGSRGLTGKLGLASLALALLSPFTCGLTALVALVVAASACVGSRAWRARRGEVVLAAAAVLASAAELCVVVALPAVTGTFRALDCHRGLVQLQLSLCMYRVDWDEHYPRGADWCDAIWPYARYPSLYVCPALPNAPCGYALNRSLSSMNHADVERPDRVPMLYDAPGGWNTTGAEELFVPRHRRYGNMAFADSHVTYVGPKDVSALAWNP